MRQSVVKRLRREVNERNKGVYVQHEYHPSNPDFKAMIDSIGLERVVAARNCAPLSSRMVEGCKRLELKNLKKEYRSR